MGWAELLTTGSFVEEVDRALCSTAPLDDHGIHGQRGRPANRHGLPFLVEVEVKLYRVLDAVRCEVFRSVSEVSLIVLKAAKGLQKAKVFAIGITLDRCRCNASR
jgi:hypothetical protein